MSDAEQSQDPVVRQFDECLDRMREKAKTMSEEDIIKMHHAVDLLGKFANQVKHNEGMVAATLCNGMLVLEQILNGNASTDYAAAKVKAIELIKSGRPIETAYFEALVAVTGKERS